MPLFMSISHEPVYRIIINCYSFSEVGSAAQKACTRLRHAGLPRPRLLRCSSRPLIYSTQQGLPEQLKQYLHSAEQAKCQLPPLHTLLCGVRVCSSRRSCGVFHDFYQTLVQRAVEHLCEPLSEDEASLTPGTSHLGAPSFRHMKSFIV